MCGCVRTLGLHHVPLLGAGLAVAVTAHVEEGEEEMVLVVELGGQLDLELRDGNTHAHTFSLGKETHTRLSSRLDTHKFSHRKRTHTQSVPHTHCFLVTLLSGPPGLRTLGLPRRRTRGCAGDAVLQQRHAWCTAVPPGGRRCTVERQYGGVGLLDGEREREIERDREIKREKIGRASCRERV